MQGRTEPGRRENGSPNSRLVIVSGTPRKQPTELEKEGERWLLGVAVTEIILLPWVWTTHLEQCGTVYR